MSKDKELPTDDRVAQYLDQEVPLQQQENDKFNDLPAFTQAQLAYAKSKHSKQKKTKQRAYKKRWIKKGGINE